MTVRIRVTNPVFNRAGQWAALEDTCDDLTGHRCYKALFPDGVVRMWSVYDLSAGYEIRHDGDDQPQEEPAPEPGKPEDDASVEEIRTEFGTSYEVREVPLRELFTDHGITMSEGQLQRPLQYAWARRIAERFDINRWMEQPPRVSARAPGSSCGCFRCSHRREGVVTCGSYHVFDGQHVTVAMRLWLLANDQADKLDTMMVPVHYYGELKRDEEAYRFVVVNSERKESKGIDEFLARVAHGDRLACEVQDKMDRNGWRAGSSSRGQLPGMTTLYKEAVKFGTDCVDIALNVATAFDHQSVSAALLSALTEMNYWAVQEHVEVNIDALKAAVIKVGLPHLKGTKYECWWSVIKVYNARRPAQNRIPAPR